MLVLISKFKWSKFTSFHSSIFTSYSFFKDPKVLEFLFFLFPPLPPILPFFIKMVHMMMFISVLTGLSCSQPMFQQSIQSTVVRVILLKQKSDHITALLWPSSGFLTQLGCKSKSLKTSEALRGLLHVLTFRTSPSAPPSLGSSRHPPCFCWTHLAHFCFRVSASAHPLPGPHFSHVSTLSLHSFLVQMLSFHWDLGYPP